MRLIDFVARAGRIGQSSDTYNTFVCVSSEVFDALIRQHPELKVWQRADYDNSFDYRTTRLPEPHDLEVWGRSGGTVEQAAVSVFGVGIWSGTLPQSNHERLTFHVAMNASRNLLRPPIY